MSPYYRPYFVTTQSTLKRITKGTIPLCLATTLVAGCGGGGGSDTTPDSTDGTNTGTFVDSRVSGISYTTESGSGETDSNGQFPYKDGETVTFSIGAITLPTVAAQPTITPLDIFSTSDINNTPVVNLARYLQTIDADGDPGNGIEITQGAREAAGGAVSVDFQSDNFDTQIQPIIDASGIGDRALISEQDALSHLQESLDSLPPQGTYFEVYGMSAGDYKNTTKGRTLIGTSQGGLNFDVSGHDRFLIFVPAGSDRVFLDAVGYQNGSSEWLNSIMGDEYMHRSVEFTPYSSDPDCDWDGTCPMKIEGTSVTSVPGENYIEGGPDNYAIASNPEEDSYYQYSTFSADSMRVYLTSSPIE